LQEDFVLFILRDPDVLRPVLCPNRFLQFVVRRGRCNLTPVVRSRLINGRHPLPPVEPTPPTAAMPGPRVAHPMLADWRVRPEADL